MHYIKNRIWDLLLCLLCQIGLVFSVLSGFLLDDPVYNNVAVVIVMMFVLDILFFVFAYDRILTIAGVAIGVIVLGVFIFYAANSQIFKDEAAHSLGITLVVVAFTSLGIFLLGRSRAGIIVLFAVGTIISFFTYFMEFPVRTWTFFVFVFAVLMYFLYRNYCITVSRVHTGKVRVPTFIIQAAIVCLLAFGLGFGIYKGVVEPLNPPTRELKLITKMKDMDLFKFVGVSAYREMLDPDKYTEEELQQIIDYTNQLIDEGEIPEEMPTEENPDAEHDDVEQAMNDVSTFATNLMHNIFHNYGFVYIIAVIAVIIVALFVIRYLRRKKWRDSVNALSPENQVINYYQYFMTKFAKLGYKKPINHTLIEYSGNISHEMEAFQCGDITFEKLTDVYIRTFYGRKPVSEEEAGWFKTFYNNFKKNTKREIGFFRYCLKYFAI